MTRAFGLAPAIALAVLSATAAPVGAVAPCHGIKRCAPVEGPWVLARAGVESDFLLLCPKRGVVAGVDAAATTTAVRLSFDGRLGAPVSPGITTTSSAFFRGILVRGREAFFQPWLGCIGFGGGGRSTVSARVSAPGAALERRARIVELRRGQVRTVSIGCSAGEQLVGGWDAIAFYTKKPPRRRMAAQVRSTRASLAGGKVWVRVDTGDALSADAHALLQLGATCAP